MTPKMRGVPVSNDYEVIIAFVCIEKKEVYDESINVKRK